MRTTRRAARAQVARDDGGLVPAELRSHGHAAWGNPVRLVSAGWLTQGEAEWLTNAPGCAELMRHRAIDRWAEANGYVDGAGHVDIQRLTPTERGY